MASRLFKGGEILDVASLPVVVSPHLRSMLDDRARMLDSLLGNLDGMAYCCLFDDDWTMLFVSDGCRAVTGYTPAEMLFNRKISYEAITFEDDRAMVRESIEQVARSGRHFEIEYRICHADGGLRWVLERGAPLRNETGNIEALEGFIQDITRLKDSEQAAMAAEERYRSIFENAIEGIYQSTPSGQYLNFNPALARIYGYDSPEDLKQGISDIKRQLYVENDMRDKFIALMEAHGSVHNFEAQVYRKQGDIIWISENAREVRDDHGHLLFYEGTVEDITERKNYEQQIEYQATHDSLTGLPNRALLADRLQQCISFAERYQSKLAVAFVDLDQFKLVNDSKGHYVGDQLLVTMAERLSRCVRESDTVVRLGGDEFVLLITSLQKVEDISQSMQRVLSAVAESFDIDGWNYQVSCSVGVSVYPDDARDADTLLKNADSAMFKAKQSGRNNFQFYTQELNTALIERMDIESSLRRAIDQQEFVLHYQPKVNMARGTVCGAEALIRWQPQPGRLVSPSSFIPIAEESGLIDEIGLWALKAACRKAVEIQRAQGVSLPIAVNVSARQFRQPGLVSMVASVLQETGLTANGLELEITESMLVQDTDHFINTLHDLKALGVSLAIDDFGTGYSSMAYLKDFPVDRLKVDKLFVDNLEHEAANRAILKAIIALGHSLDMKVVAEGVETAYQHAFLQAIGCDEMQGYFFSRPLPADDFVHLLQSR